METFHELVYAGKEVEAIVKTRYPDARVKDASDFIHEERFELEIDGVTEDDFYPFAIHEGFARCCLGFELTLQSIGFPESKNRPAYADTKQKLDKWIAAAKEGKNGT